MIIYGIVWERHRIARNATGMLLVKTRVAVTPGPLSRKPAPWLHHMNNVIHYFASHI